MYELVLFSYVSCMYCFQVGSPLELYHANIKVTKFVFMKILFNKVGFLTWAISHFKEFG